MPKIESRSKLAWRCRRGTLELDLILERFLEREYDNVAASEKTAFDRLLDLQDPELLKYLMGRERPVDQDLVAIVKKIRSVSPN